MRDYLNDILNIISPTRTEGVVVPIGDPRYEAADGSTVTAQGGLVAAVFTYTPGVRTSWTKQTYYRGRGRVPTLSFNGTTEYLIAPDNAAWTRSDLPFSVFAWCNVTTPAVIGEIFAKYDDSVGGAEEWKLDVTSTNTLVLTFRDATVGVTTFRTSNAAVPAGRLAFFAATYDGTGGAIAANNIKLYVNGALIASTATNNAAFVTLRNTLGGVTIGVKGAPGIPARWFTGSMLGSAPGPGFSTLELTAVQIAAIYQIGLEAQRNFGLVTRILR